MPFTLLLAALSIQPVLGHGTPYDGLPDMGEAVDRKITLAEELAMGEGFAKALRKQAVFIDHPLLNHYVQALGERLAAASGWSAYPFNFTVIRDDSVNAFAAPGGHISLFSGLILRTENENELAGVMAHEMAHITQRHIARMIAGSSSMSLTALAALAAAALVGGSNPNMAAAAFNLSMAGAIQQQISFTRAHEYEADRIGIQILSKAQFDPQGMVSFFEKLAREEGDGLFVHNEMLRTHPVTTRRIAEAAERAQSMRPAQVFNLPDYAYAKATLAAITHKNPKQGIRDLDISRGDAVKSYLRAMLLLQAGDNLKARKLLEDLHRVQPDNIWIACALASSQMKLGDRAASTALLEQQLKLYPRHPVLIQQLAANWLDIEPERSYQLLREALREQPDHLRLLQSFADAALRANRRAEHHEAMGLLFIKQQRLPEARAELESARALSASDPIARQRLDALIDKVEKSINERQRNRKL